MIVSIWVFFMLGDPTPAEPGTAYIQCVASPYEHDTEGAEIESEMRKRFAEEYPGHVMTDSGWKPTYVKVMGG